MICNLKLTSLLSTLFCLFLCNPLIGNDGTYTGVSGNWSNAAGWQSSIVADGANNTATFTGAGSAHYIVTNDGARTIGNIEVNHKNNDYSFNITSNVNNDAITLQTSSSTPKIKQTKGSITISAPLAGSQGVEIMGAAMDKSISLTNPESTYSGGTVVSSGYLRLGASSDGPTLTKGPLGVGDLTLKDGVRFSSVDNSLSISIYNNVILESGTIYHSHGNAYGALALYGTLTFLNDVTLNGTQYGMTSIHGKIIDTTNNHKLIFTGNRPIRFLNNESTYGGGTVINMTGSNPVYLYANTTNTPPTNGPFGVGPVSLVSGTLSAWTTTPITNGNPFSLDGDFNLSHGDNYGRMFFTGPWTVTGNRTLTSMQNDSHFSSFENLVTDNGKGYDLNLRGSSSRSIHFGGTVTLGALRVWDANMVIKPESTWHTKIILAENRAVLRLFNSQDNKTTTIAPVIFENCSAYLWPQGDMNAPGNCTWIVPSLTRNNRATLLISGYTSGSIYHGPQFGALAVNDKIYVTEAPATVNGMVAPYLMEGTGDFLTYDGSGSGFKRATYTANNNINVADPNAIVAIASMNHQTLNSDNEIYALKINNSHIYGVGKKLTIGSGGLSYVAGSNPRMECDLAFGNAEGLIYNIAIADLQGEITGSNGLTRWGSGKLYLSHANNYTGVTTLNDGETVLKAAGALPAGQPLVINGRADLNIGGASGTTTLELNGYDIAPSSIIMSGGQIINNSANEAVITLPSSITYNGSVNAAGIWPYRNRPARAVLADNKTTTFWIADGNASYDFYLGNWSNESQLPVSGTDVTVMKRGPGRMLIAAFNSSFTGTVVVEDGMLVSYLNAKFAQSLGNAANNLQLQRNGVLSFSGGGLGTSASGTLTFSGGNRLRRDAGDGAFTLVLTNMSRSARGTLVMQGTATGDNDYWGSGLAGYGKLVINDWKSATPPNVNGMYHPYIMNAGYNIDNGLGSFAFVMQDTGVVSRLNNVGSSLGNYAKGTIASAGATHTVDMTATAALAANAEIWALRTTANLTASGDPTLTLGSGGLICNANLAIAPKLRFGTGANDAEAIIYVAGGYEGSAIRTATLNGAITTDKGLTKVGGGILALAADNSSTLSGDHWINEGTLQLADSAALKSDANVNIERGAAVDIAGNYTLAHNFKGLGTITTGNNTLTLTGSLTPGFSVGTLNVENLDFQGTLNWEYDENGGDLVACQSLTFGGNKTVKASWIGQGPAQAGAYPLFSYKGSDPSLGNWNATVPSGMVGTVSLDTTNKLVMLELSAAPSGTVIIFR